MKKQFTCWVASIAIGAAGLAGWALPGTANSARHQVAYFPDSYLVGQSQGGALKPPLHAGAKPNYAAANYRIYARNRYLGEVRGGKPHQDGPPCEDTWFVKFTDADRKKYAQGVVALTGRWNALPRVPRRDKVVQPVYKQEVANFLKRGGIKNPVVKIDEVLRVDLDGDGSDEVLITATNQAGYIKSPKPFELRAVRSGAKAGEYSVVLLRRLVRGKLQTVALAKEIYSRQADFSAPNIAEVAGVFDLDGDGKMEILIKGEYYEGYWTTVFSATGAVVKELTTGGCGA